MAEKIIQDVSATQDALANAVKAARDAGYAVSFQSNDGKDYYPVVSGGPVEDVEVVVLPVQPAPAPAATAAQPIQLTPTAKDVNKAL